MRGRPPVPTALKLLRGNPSKRALNADEPEIPVAEITQQPPDFLQGYALEAWHRFIGQLTISRVLTLGDMPVFEAFCQQYGEWRTYIDKVQDEGAYAVIQRKDKQGKAIEGSVYTEWNPARIMRDNARTAMEKLASKLGLTPSDRSRVVRAAEQGSKGSSADAIKRSLVVRNV